MQGIGNLRTVLDLLKRPACPQDRVTIDLGLARGLDYYTGIVFETTVKGWEKFGSIASGGRYDNLASLFTPRRLPGVGASIGLDRLLAPAGRGRQAQVGDDHGAGAGGELSGDRSDRSLYAWRRGCGPSGIGAEVYPDPIPIGKQMGYGSIRGHKLAVIVGPDEMAGQVFNLRNLSNRQEDKGLAWSVLEDSVAERAADPQAGRDRLMTPPEALIRDRVGARVAERPVGLVRGTRDWLPPDLAPDWRRSSGNCSTAFARPATSRCAHRSSNSPICTSARAARDRLQAFELAGGGSAAICLRPELTASIVRAYTEAPECPPLPWRVSSSGPVFRYRERAGPGAAARVYPGRRRDARRRRAGGRRRGDRAGRPVARRRRALPTATIRIGHVGLDPRDPGHAGLPPPASSALVEMLSAAAAEGKGIQALESALERLARLAAVRRRCRSDRAGGQRNADDRGVDRLFRQLVPDVTGRRSGHEIIRPAAE